jgi:hypothetical protein
VTQEKPIDDLEDDAPDVKNDPVEEPDDTGDPQ